MVKDLINALRDGEYLTLETTPGHSATIDNILKKIENLELDKDVTGFSATDNPLAKLKYNAILAAIKIQEKFDKPVMATMSMRDRNKIALQSDLLGANDFDIRNILALTGDPARMSDQPHTKGVFEGNSNLLLNMIKSFNVGMDYAGKPFKEKPKTIYPFAVTNSFAKSQRSLAKKINSKVENGAVGIISQPVYDLDNAKQLIEIMKDTTSNFHDDRKNSELIIGLFPMTKLRTAQFLASHVPGIHVPNSWIDALTKANSISPEEEYKVGLELSKNLFKDIKKIHPKIHFMTANQFDLAKEIFND